MQLWETEELLVASIIQLLIANCKLKFTLQAQFASDAKRIAIQFRGQMDPHARQQWELFDPIRDQGELR